MSPPSRSHRRIRSVIAGLFVGWLTVPVLLWADDWPQAQGPRRDNKSGEQGLLTEWPDGGPALLWTFNDAGVGYSAPAVVRDLVYLMGSRDGKTELIAIDSTGGSETWSLPINDKSFDFEGNSWGAGPRAAPTVAGGLIYALGGDGQLACATVDGKMKWQTNMLVDLGGSVKNVDAGEPQTTGWGFCWAPLVDDDRVICVPGSANGAGLIVALDKATGKLLWRSKQLDEEATYSSPIAATIDGIRQYIVMTQFGTAAVAANDGSLLWYYKRSRPYPSVVIPTPVYYDNHVYTSAAAGCDMFNVTKGPNGTFAVTKVYTSRNMKNELGGFVLHEGYVYGTSERRGWVCQDFMTGKIAWYQRANKSVGDGSVIFADGHLYLYGENTSEVALIEASSDAWMEKGRFRLPESSPLKATNGKNWTHPVIADGKLYLRDQDLLFCYKVK